jgi:hypothetical protein
VPLQQLELAVLVLKLLEPLQLRHAHPRVLPFPPEKRLLVTPILRPTSTTGVPLSAGLSANAICSSVSLLFFIDRPPKQRPDSPPKALSRLDQDLGLSAEAQSSCLGVPYVNLR